MVALTASGLAVGDLGRCRLVALPCLPLLGGQVEVLVRALTVSRCSLTAAVRRWIAFELLPGVGAAGELPPADAAAVLVPVSGEVLVDDVGVGVAPFSLDECDALGRLQVNHCIGSTREEFRRAWNADGGAHDWTFTTK